jgi:hypothetical protein
MGGKLITSDPYQKAELTILIICNRCFGRIIGAKRTIIQDGFAKSEVKLTNQKWRCEKAPPFFIQIIPLSQGTTAVELMFSGSKVRSSIPQTIRSRPRA